MPSAEASAELRERGSRFLAVVAPASSEAEARARIELAARLHRDATHVCWAWRLGDPARERSADAGEPAGTAGVPILQALRSAELADAVALVARWFGGTKLGKGGLARAYRDAARGAIAAVATVRRVPTVELVVTVAPARVGALRRLLHPPVVELVAERWAEHAELRLRVHREAAPALRAALAEIGLEARDVPPVGAPDVV